MEVFCNYGYVMSLIKEKDDRIAIVGYTRDLVRAMREVAVAGDFGRLRRHVEAAMSGGWLDRDSHGMHPVVRGWIPRSHSAAVSHLTATWLSRLC